MAEKISKIDIDEMMERGVHLGHRTTRLHPKMKDFVVGIKNTVHVIDLEKTKQGLEKALEFLGSLAKEKKTILFVSTKTPFKKLIEETAKELNMPYVTERWLGGTFTNFKVIRGRAQHYKKLKEEKAKGELDKYTKKERIKINKEMADLEKKFSGIEDREERPAAKFKTDIVKDDLAVKEAGMKNIPIVAIVDSNADISKVDYPIVGNDDAMSSVKYILDKIKEAVIINQ